MLMVSLYVDSNLPIIIFFTFSPNFMTSYGNKTSINFHIFLTIYYMKIIEWKKYHVIFIYNFFSH